VNDLTIGLLSALLATNQPQAVSNLIQRQTGASVAIANPSDSAEQELQKLMIEDDDAQAEVDKWIQENNAFAASGAGETKAELNKRILARFDSVRKDYQDFLKRHPDSARGHLAYGSFLNDIGDEEASKEQNETARQLDPKNPAAWNNLANYYGEFSPVTNAFVYYAKASELNPNEPVYYQNFATTVYLFRKDAMEFYGINEQQVFDKALALYQKAVRLAPDDFPLATDYAQSYYGIKPLRTNDALVAWTNALNIAHDDIEREGVYIHLARFKMAAGRFDEARAQLDAVTNSMYGGLKTGIERELARRESGTNEIADDVSTNNVVIPTNAAAVSTNVLIAPTNAPSSPTNSLIVSTNPIPIFTNAIPALTNPPVFVPKTAEVLTNVPPISPKASSLKMLSTNSP
jgi:predicted Zn-dependent protease